MSPLRFISPRLAWSRFDRACRWMARWQFWITLAFFGLGGVYVLGYIENGDRVADNVRALRASCLAGNDSRAASRLAWAAVEAYIVQHSRTPVARAEVRMFFDTVFGPLGRRDKVGPLRDRPC